MKNTSKFHENANLPDKQYFCYLGDFWIIRCYKNLHFKQQEDLMKIKNLLFEAYKDQSRDLYSNPRSLFVIQNLCLCHNTKKFYMRRKALLFTWTTILLEILATSRKCVLLYFTKKITFMILTCLQRGKHQRTRSEILTLIFHNQMTIARLLFPCSSVFHYFLFYFLKVRY